MALAVYIKAQPKLKRETKKRDQFFFGLISLIGLVSIIIAIWPYVVWQITILPKLTGKIDQAPVPQSQILSTANSLAANTQVVQDPDGFSYFVPTNFSKEEERNKSSSPAANYKLETRPNQFFLTIPKLQIEKAVTKVDSLRFDSSLAHFPGSALPGEVGNSFITGHSVLPQFADPKNYRAIFTELSDLEVGDDVLVEMGDQTYHYVVQYAKVVDPQDLSVLAPISKTGRNLTLMTCVPPGTNIKRLVVITSLLLQSKNIARNAMRGRYLTIFSQLPTIGT